ncbi:telomerase reverse transcriptase-like [Tetranychus urticae]|uniref:telomerase reverse transcriptase-like n=1 Tax=Tetranychus urticae TaxID=32264 RepID=UPI000356242C|nr:telomerase reverse transcriptase-like [Tetranychus urticae]
MSNSIVSHLNLNLEHFHMYYSTVTPFSQVISELNLESNFNQSYHCVFNRIILTSKSVFDIKRLKLIKPIDQSRLKENLKERLGAYYHSQNVSSNSIRLDYVLSYYSSPPFSKFIRMLDPVSTNYLIRACSFFEFIDDSFILQRTGPYFCDFVWNKDPPILESSRFINPNKDSAKRQIETDDLPRKKLYPACDNWCNKFKSLDRHSLPPITKKKMLYGKQNYRYFNSYLDVTPRNLTSRIFSSVDTEVKDQLPLEPLTSTLDQTLKLSKRCKFINLLHKFCPAVDTTISLDSSEATQSSLKSYNDHNQVISFMYSVYHHLFPQKIFGSRSNCQGIFERLKLLVTTGSKVRFIVSNFRPPSLDLDSCGWMNNLKCIHKKIYIFDFFLFWLVEYFINLLKNHFYITESTSSKLYFYTYPVWNSIQDKYINKLVKEGKLKPVEIQEIKQETHMDKLLLRSSNLRFIPRSRKLRIINRLRIAGKNETRTCLQVLSYFLGRMVCSSASQRHRQNIAKLQTMMKLSESKKLYFVRVDIVNCYPSIDQGKLFDLVCNQLEQQFSYATTKDPLKIKEFDLVKSCVTKLAVKKHHFSNESRTQFTELINRLSSNQNNCVVVPKRSLTNYFLQDIRALFRSYILTPYLRLGPNRYYQLLKGIRQGGALSSDLCSFFISHVLDRVIDDFGLQNEEARLIIEDDIVFVTSSLERAQRYLSLMLNDFPKHGLEINTKKLQFNFDFPTNGLCQSEFFTFFGRDIYLNSKKVLSNYDKYQTESCQYFFNCNPFTPKNELRKSLINQLNLSMLPWDLDCSMNDDKSVALNIYQRALLQSSRLSCYLVSSPKYRSLQVPKYWIKFATGFAKHLFAIKEKWIARGLIDCPFTLNFIKWLISEAIYKQLGTLRMRHRKTEKEMFEKFVKTSRKNVPHMIRTNFFTYVLKENTFNINTVIYL